MAQEDDDVLRLALTEGWEVKGYSTVMMAAGAMVHSVLLQKGIELVTVNVVKSGAKELGRTKDVLTPMSGSEKPKSFWS